MAVSLDVEIVTPHGVVFSGPVDSLVAPGVDGYLGVLPHHAAMIAELKVGEVRVRVGDDWRRWAISGGVLHVHDRRAVVLSEAVEAPEDIDVRRAEEARRRAEERLRQHRHDHEVDVDRAQAALVRAANRLRLAGRPGIDS